MSDDQDLDDLDGEYGYTQDVPPAPGVPQVPPVAVRATAPPLAASHGAFATVVVDTGVNPVRRLLPRDPQRTEAIVIVADEPVVLAQSKEMAENPANANQGTAADGNPPVGAYLPASWVVRISHRDAVWVAATSSTPGRVSAIISREGPPEDPG